MLPIINTKEIPEGHAIEIDGDVMTPEAYEERLRTEYQTVQADLVAMRDEWVRHRAQSGVEDRWRKAGLLYHGDENASADSAFIDNLKSGPASRRKSPQRSRVVVNIVRPKVHQAHARMCEILLPVDDKCWGIKPTPVPETVQSMVGSKAKTVMPGTDRETGLTADDEAQAFITAAKDACTAMERSIDDSLTECGYNGEQRAGLEDGIKLGTMILKGPFPAVETAKVWQPGADGASEMVVNNKTVPASVRVDPWDVWFDPACGNDHQRGQGVWHRRFVTRKEIRALVDIPGFNSGSLREVLRQSPARVRVAEGRVMRHTGRDLSYELWEYHGEIEPEHMQLCSLGTGDPLEDVDFGVIMLINDRVVGTLPSWIPDRSLPYDVWCWRNADDSPYGYGLPAELEHQQRVVTAAWRQVMDHGKNTVGGQIVVRGGVEPDDGVWELSPNKVWRVAGDIDDVSKVFNVVTIPSNLKDLMAIATTAMQFADQESSMPQLLGGDKGSAAETVGGMVMQQQNATSVLRLRVKLYDDKITRPHIGRYYDWKMANDDDPKIKGDFEVDARGSTALLEKDVQNQGLLGLANVTNNPRYAPHLNPRKELATILKAFRVTPEDIMLTADEEKQAAEQAAQSPPQDPNAAKFAAQMEIKKLDIEDKKAQREADSQRQAMDLDVKREGLAYNTERERAESEQQAAQTQLTRELAIAKMHSDGTLSQAELEEKSRLEMIKLDQKAQLFNAEAALRVRTGAGI